MSNDKDNFNEESPEWEDAEEAKKEPIEEMEETYTFEQPEHVIEQSPESTEPTIETEEELKKKKRRTIIIIVFAIVLPVILGVTGLGFLIWGLVVGFTNCWNSCCSAFDNCFGCCDSCNESCNSCTNCCDDCSSCGNCCGSSTIEQRGIEKFTSIIKDSFKTSISMMKWYYYYIREYIGNLFFK